jgi:heme/copper-type cytochrome/quinol oxidase subunit 2
MLTAALLAVVFSGAALVAQAKRDFTVTGRKYSYTVSDSTAPEIRVHKDDMVTITFTVTDIAHSFTISDDHYRIDRRAEPGKPATFRFLAGTAGEFAIRCTLTIDERCQREMRGKLIVTDPAVAQPRR